MTAYTKLVSNLLFPLHERLKGHTSVVVRKQLEQSQWWSSSQLEALRCRNLQSLLQHAFEHVPYYRGVMDELGLTPADANSVEWLQKMPFLTKEIIRANTDDLKADNATGLQRFNTGGSTGEPLVFYIGRERISHDVAAKWRATRWWDVDIGDLEIVVWGSPIELGTQDRVRALRDKILRTQLIPAFEMSETNLTRFVEQIKQARPAMLFGYPSSLSLIAKHADKIGQKMDTLGIKVAFVTSEKLYDNQRSIIESTFGCPVANGYGGRDAGFIAHQCPEDGMHITAEDIIVEIIDENGLPQPAGVAGEVVITHLATGDFPFIRYRTGDIAVLDDGSCACGRGLPMLKEIQGRTTDFVIAQDGTVMHGLALIYILRDTPGIESFQVVQRSRELVDVYIVVGDEYGDKEAESIISGFRKRLGESVQVCIEKVPRIMAEKSGKYRYIKSEI